MAHDHPQDVMSSTGERRLGDFLRSRRLRLDPEALGIIGSRRRRTPGLRRQEVAERAGISSEWYVKLEQGRGAAPSAETLAALGGALLLDELEMAHLRRLASDTPRPAFTRETAPPALVQLISALAEPAYLTGERWDLLAWNAAAESVFGFGDLPGKDRNILLYMLTTEAAKTLFGSDWRAQARRMVSLFRPVHDRRAGDPAFDDLVARLKRESADVAAWWDPHDIGAPVSGSKTLHTRTQGRLRFDYATFQSNDDAAVRLALYVPASPDRD